MHGPSSLDRKLLRDLWHFRGQVVAIAVVIGAGVGMYVMAKGMLDSLYETRAAYYERYRFADLFAPAKRAPESLLATIHALPGVKAAASRVRAGVLLDVPGMAAPVTGLLLSAPERRGARINDVHLLRGRLPDPRQPEEVTVVEGFASAHQLALGDRISAVINGRKRSLTVVGHALAPEFIYALPPGDLVPDDKRFGVLWMGRKALAQAYELDGAFNEVVLLISRGANQTTVIEAVDRLLEPYGGTGAYGRDRQMSDQFLSNEMKQLDTMSKILPPVFLLVAAFLLNVVTSRLIETEREQIGLLKAFGYADGRVAQHYLKFAAAIVLLGLLIGGVLGAWLGRGIAALYMQYFKFPFLLFRATPDIYAQAVLVSLAAGSLGTISSVRKAARLSPAVAMQPLAPPDYSHTAGGRKQKLLRRWLDQPSRMILRHIRRWPSRAALTVLGIGLAMGLMIGTSFSIDAMNYMIDVSFNRIDRQDMTVSFVEPRGPAALDAVTQLPGVMAAEPFRVVSARLVNGWLSRRDSIIGLLDGSDLSRTVDAGLRPVRLPAHGLVLSDKLAELLQLRVGEKLRVEVLDGKRPVREVEVSKVVTSFMGTPAYMRLDALNRLLGEGPRLNGAYLAVDESKMAALYRQLKNTPAVAGVSMQNAAQQAFDQAMDESLGTFTFFNALFAALICVGVVYNAARVSLSERARELASLRVLGFTRGEVSFILLGETGVLVAMALPLGALLGYALAATLAASLDTELFRIPLVIAPATFGFAALVVTGAAIASGLLVRRRIDRLDLVAVLKTRD